MIISAEVKCRTCDLVFCCAKCRIKHEDGTHPEMAMIRKICYICNNRPFPLRRDTVISPNNLLLAHVFKEHLPLRCNSCTQLFLSPDDFHKIGKCFQFCPTAAAAEKQGGCLLESQQEVATIPVPARRRTVDDDEEKENVDKGIAVIVPAVTEPKQRPQKRRSIPPSGDLYPVPEPQQETGEEVDEALLTPLTKINLRWKRKSRQSFDSLLSTTANNNSSTLEGNRVADAPGKRSKLVRSTSTPMYQWQILPSMKLSNDSFTATLGQMSSIHCSSGSDTDSRADDICSPPPMSAPSQPPAPEIVVAEPSPAEDFHKVRAIIRNQSKAAATPLRQVMSKSIQRAIAQHTQHTRQQQYQQLGAYSKMLQPGTQRKMSFSSSISSVGNDSSSSNNSTIASPVPDPLDLRTTPVMKRGGKETRAKSMTTVQPSIVSAVNDVQHPDNENETEYYETHRDLESLRAADETTAAERENQENNWKLGIGQPVNRSYERTPKTSGTLLKKVISFHGISTAAQADKNNTEQEADEEDVWGTPCAVVPPMRSYSCSAVGLGNTFQATSSPMDPASEANADEVFSASTEQNVPKEKAGSHKEYEMGAGKMAGPVGGGGSRLWSIVSNVIRLASRSDVLQEESPQPAAESSAQSVGGGIVRRAMSLADYLKTRYTGEHGGGAVRRTSSSGSDEYRVAAASNCKKRKRATSVYAARSAYGAPPMLPSVTKVTYSPAAKRKRIQARQPIRRLRHGSDDSGSN
ncbi:mitosis initiation protein fs(1)Ya [Anopheles aquasalis]|uniref:mitosis initiation protein fs(1)Ya n=1 Tax=Anopheles aquasalis TaxID=42839 RepID=UPI00215B5B6A|nr:mitosis initiation protein fs(1)Ya [Anopheles aquasalis]